MQDALDEIDIREIAHELRRDVRTVRRVVKGETVRGVAGAEIARAIRQRIARQKKARP
jgi:predicted transcriptional regulator